MRRATFADPHDENRGDDVQGDVGDESTKGLKRSCLHDIEEQNACHNKLNANNGTKPHQKQLGATTSHDAHRNDVIDNHSHDGSYPKDDSNVIKRKPMTQSNQLCSFKLTSASKQLGIHTRNGTQTKYLYGSPCWAND